MQTATGKVPTLEQVQKTIIEAGVKNEWVMAVVKPGEIRGTLSVRNHMAVVTIPFTPEALQHSLQGQHQSQVQRRPTDHP